MENRYTLESVKKQMLEYICCDRLEGHRPLIDRNGNYVKAGEDDTGFAIFNEREIVVCSKCRCAVHIDRAALELNPKAFDSRPTPPFP